MQIVISIVVTLVVLTVLVVSHEYGHYVVAKKHGIKVSEFAVGFGPRLIKWNRNGTEFSIRLFFIGGFNRFADDEEREPQEGDFRAAPLKSRFLTIIAGPAMNVLVALILSVVVLMAIGTNQVVVDRVESGSPAYESGLQEGDVIRKFNGVDIQLQFDWQDAASAEKTGDALALIVERDGERMELSVPYIQSEDGSKRIGIEVNPYGSVEKFSFFESIGLGFKWLYYVMREMFSSLGKLFFRGEGLENMAGIVGITQIVGTVAMSGGFYSLLSLAALLSVNLAIVNLLPIPALDGGKIVLYAVEGVRKKPASEKVEGVMNLIGMVVIYGLAIFLVIQDISRLVM